MKRAVIATATLVFASSGVAVLANSASRRRAEQERCLQSVMQAAVREAEITARRAEQAHRQLMERMERDPDVRTTVLKGLKLSIEIQPQWVDEEGITAIQLNLEKPIGERFLVDGLDQASILYVDHRPLWLLRESRGPVRRDVLPAEMGSRCRMFRLESPIPRESMLRVEWCNYNPRTESEEHLRTEAFRYEGGKR